MRQMKETTLRIFDGYAQFQPDGYAADPDARPHHRPSRRCWRARPRASPGVTAAAPRVNGFAILANGSRSYARGGGRRRSGRRSEDLVHRRAASPTGAI